MSEVAAVPTTSWVAEFQKLVVLCMENRMFRTDNGFAEETRRMAARLTGHELRAKDVARVHHGALAVLVAGETAERAHSLLDAAEETLIALLGHMADAYLDQGTSAGRSAGRTAGPGDEPADRPELTDVRLRLVVAGHTARTRKLESLLQELVALRHPATTEVVVTDLTAQPELFSELEVLATPVIIRESPGPARRLVGSGADLEQVVEQLELTVPAGARTPTVFSPLRVAPAPGDPLVRTG